MYRKFYEPIVVYNVDSETRTNPVSGDAQEFLGWSPSGAWIAHSTGGSIYEENSLYVTNLESKETALVSTRTGLWSRSDFEWIVDSGVEVLALKNP